MKYNKTMNKKITPVMVLIVILIVVTGFLGFGMYRMQQAVSSLAADFSFSAGSGSPITTDNKLFDLYAGIYSNLEQYGVTDQYGQESAELANAIYDKTFKECSITSVEYEDDGFLVTLEGEGIPLSKFSGSLWTSAVAKATGSFLSNHFFEAAAALFKGEDAIKEMLFKDFGEDIFNAADKEIAEQPMEKVRYQFAVIHKDEGWTIELKNEQILTDEKSEVE